MAKEKVNPFEQGVTYEQFLKALPEKTTIKDYLKDLCTEDEIAWIEVEIENYNLNNKTKEETTN